MENLAALAASLDAGDFQSAAQVVRRMMFIERFEDEVARVFDLVSE